MITILKAFVGFIIKKIKDVFTTIIQDTVFEYFTAE